MAMIAVKCSRPKKFQTNIVREHDLFMGIFKVSLNWIVTPSERNFLTKLKPIMDMEWNKLLLVISILEQRLLSYFHHIECHTVRKIISF